MSGSSSPADPALLALFATIREEYTNVIVWARLAPMMRGIPTGDAFDHLVDALLAIEERESARE